MLYLSYERHYHVSKSEKKGLYQGTGYKLDSRPFSSMFGFRRDRGVHTFDSRVDLERFPE